MSALTYAESEDTRYGVNLAAGPDDAVDKLMTFNEHGVRISERKLSQQIPTGGDFGHTPLAWANGWLFLIQSRTGEMSEAETASPPQRACLIDPKTGVVHLALGLRPVRAR